MALHLVPEPDLIEHVADLEQSCLCGPIETLFIWEDLSEARYVVHQSLDH